MRRFKPDTWIALSAVIVSLAALLLTMYQAYLSRRVAILGVRPRLWVASANSPGEYSIAVTNHGLGPAVIQTYELSVDGLRATSWHDALRRLQVVTYGDSATLMLGGLYPEQMISAGASRTILRARKAVCRVC